MAKTMIVAGIGCKRGAAAHDIEAALRAALAHVGLAATALDAIATIDGKDREPGISTVAEKFGLRVVTLPQSELKAASDRVATHSPRVLQLTGLPSVAETAALAAAGPRGRLLAARRNVGGATCALAASGDTP
jgi:cobalt-precorrin 5A hydrolase